MIKIVKGPKLLACNAMKPDENDANQVACGGRELGCSRVTPSVTRVDFFLLSHNQIGGDSFGFARIISGP